MSIAFDGSSGLLSGTIWIVARDRVAGAAGDVVPRVGIQLILVRFLLNHRLVAAAILAVNLFPGHILYLL